MKLLTKLRELPILNGWTLVPVVLMSYFLLLSNQKYRRSLNDVLRGRDAHCNYIERP